MNNHYLIMRLKNILIENKVLWRVISFSLYIRNSATFFMLSWKCSTFQRFCKLSNILDFISFVDKIPCSNISIVLMYLYIVLKLQQNCLCLLIFLGNFNTIWLLALYEWFSLHPTSGGRQALASILQFTHKRKNLRPCAHR